MEEIRAFFAMKKIRVDREGTLMLWSLACLPSHGCIRLIENVIDMVFDQEPELGIVTRENVVTAMQAMLGGESTYLQRLATRHAELSRVAATTTLAKAG